VVAEFYPAICLHDKLAALAALEGVPTLVLTGTKDLLTPPGHSAAIAEALPGAELVLIPDAGHLVMLERPDLVNTHLAALLERAAQRCGAVLPQTVRESAAVSGRPDSSVADAAVPPSPATGADRPAGDLGVQP